MMTLVIARIITAAAEKKARQIGQPMNISVVDEGGNLVHHVRMDEAWMGSIDIAIDKAFTATAFKMTTKELFKKAQAGGPFFGIQHSNHGRISTLPGGIPLEVDGRLVGAVGVSGGTGEQDHSVAAAGAAAIDGRRLRALQGA